MYIATYYKLQGEKRLTLYVGTLPSDGEKCDVTVGNVLVVGASAFYR